MPVVASNLRSNAKSVDDGDEQHRCYEEESVKTMSLVLCSIVGHLHPFRISSCRMNTTNSLTTLPWGKVEERKTAIVCDTLWLRAPAYSLSLCRSLRGSTNEMLQIEYSTFEGSCRCYRKFWTSFVSNLLTPSIIHLV